MTFEEVIERITDECGDEYNNAFLTREIQSFFVT